MPLVPGQVRKETILFHQSAKLEYDQNGSLDLEKWWDPRKVYFETDFFPEKLTEIEKFLKVAREEERNKNRSNSDHKQPPTTPILPILGIMFLIVLSVVLVWTRNKTYRKRK